MSLHLPQEVQPPALGSVVASGVLGEGACRYPSITSCVSGLADTGGSGGFPECAASWNDVSHGTKCCLDAVPVLVYGQGLPPSLCQSSNNSPRSAALRYSRKPQLSEVQ